MPTPTEVVEELKKVKYPGYSRDIVSFGIVHNVEVEGKGITVTLAPGGARPEAVEQIRVGVLAAVKTLAGVEDVRIALRQPEPPPARDAHRPLAAITGVRHIVAVASGKGGVGKSTVAVNLALALRALGKRVGLLDADVYGPSVPLMLNLSGRLRGTDDNRVIPLETLGLKVVSMGFLIGDGMPVIWRGPMVNKLLTQFLRECEWGELDVLVLDLPPGTGDAQLTIVQQAPLSGGVIVTTPQDVALLDVQRAIAMFHQVNVPVLGVIENMSYHICTGCGERTEIFGHGGGPRVADRFGVPFLGEIPLARGIREAGDAGRPTVVADPEGPYAAAFGDVATRVAEQLEQNADLELPTAR